MSREFEYRLCRGALYLDTEKPSNYSQGCHQLHCYHQLFSCVTESTRLILITSLSMHSWVSSACAQLIGVKNSVESSEILVSKVLLESLEHPVVHISWCSSLNPLLLAIRWGDFIRQCKEFPGDSFHNIWVVRPNFIDKVRSPIQTQEWVTVSLSPSVCIVDT